MLRVPPPRSVGLCSRRTNRRSAGRSAKRLALGSLQMQMARQKQKQKPSQSKRSRISRCIIVNRIIPNTIHIQVFRFNSLLPVPVTCYTIAIIYYDLAIITAIKKKKKKRYYYSPTPTHCTPTTTNRKKMKAPTQVLKPKVTHTHTLYTYTAQPRVQCLHNVTVYSVQCENKRISRLSRAPLRASPGGQHAPPHGPDRCCPGILPRIFLPVCITRH